jgi:glutaredoxin
MSESIELFSTTECPKCAKLSEYLSDLGIEYVKRVIDVDPEAETDALMLNIFSAPALRKGDTVLKTKDLFAKDKLLEDNVRTLVQS